MIIDEKPQWSIWSVLNGFARPKNTQLPFKDASKHSTIHSAIEAFAEAHTFATDAPTGDQPGREFGEVIWQFKRRTSNVWKTQLNRDKSFFKDFTAFQEILNGRFETRLFLPFIGDLTSLKKINNKKYEVCQGLKTVGALHILNSYPVFCFTGSPVNRECLGRVKARNREDAVQRAFKLYQPLIKYNDKYADKYRDITNYQAWEPIPVTYGK